MRKEAAIPLVLATLLIVASFSYIYAMRYTGLFHVITNPIRGYALPFLALGTMTLIIGLYLSPRGEPEEASSQPYSTAMSNLAFFIFVGFIMKVVAEVMHELGGHGLYILLFGGRILRVRISLLWPLQSSYIWWSLPSLGHLERSFIVGGGILNCLIVYFSLQLLLLLRPQPWRFGVPLLWFSYWSYISSAGYLISGGYGPFGDVAELIEMGILTNLTSLILGLAIFAVGYFLLSVILRRLIAPIVSESMLGYAVAGFWLTTAFVVILTVLNPVVRAPLTLIPIGFIPTFLWLILEGLWKRKLDLN